jgi:hypothetical protein
MLDILKNKTEVNAGFKIKNRGDCELLSELIFDKTSDTLSYNVLRRFFGLANYMKPNKETLNTLAKFNGYNDYPDFLLQNPYENYWTTKEKLYDIINSDSREILIFISNLNIKNKDSIDILVTLCRELIHFRRFDVLNEVLKSNNLNLNKFTYSEILHFGNSIGELLKTNYKIGENLLSNSNFLNFVYCIYIDYENINGYYSKWSRYVYENTSDIEIKCFAQAILQLKNYLNNQKVSYNKFISIDTSNFHPILQGRIFTIKILSSGFCQDDLTDKLKELNVKNDSSILLDFFYEPMTVALLSKNFSLMKAIIDILSTKKMNTKYYHQHHENLYNLMSLFYLRWSNNINNKRLAIKVNITDFKYSYRSIFNLYALIIKYHLENKNTEHLNKLNNLSIKMNHPLISKDYCISYFD